MGTENRAGNRQSQACPLRCPVPGTVCTIKAVENTLKVLGRDGWTGILDAQTDLPLITVMNPDRDVC